MSSSSGVSGISFRYHVQLGLAMLHVKITIYLNFQRISILISSCKSFVSVTNSRFHQVTFRQTCGHGPGSEYRSYPHPPSHRQDQAISTIGLFFKLFQRTIACKCKDCSQNMPFCRPHHAFCYNNLMMLSPASPVPAYGRCTLPAHRQWQAPPVHCLLQSTDSRTFHAHKRPSPENWHWKPVSWKVFIAADVSVGSAIPYHREARV